MERRELVERLKKVDAALAKVDVIPIYACFCCTEEAVFAYDDKICLYYPKPVGIVGGVRGNVLLNWLNQSKAKEVALEQTDGQLKIKAGRAKLDTVVLPPKQFLFEHPPMKKATERIFSEKMIEALRLAAAAMGSDPSKPWMLGVTLYDGEEGMIFYSTNDKTITRVILGKRPKKGRSVLLPPRFVELLLEIAKKDEPQQLYSTSSWVEATFASGLRLFSKSVEGCDETEYDRFLENVDQRTDEMFNIPKGFDRCVERSLVVIPHAKRPFMLMAADGEKLRMRTESSVGETADTLPLQGQKAIEIAVEPGRLRAGLVAASKIRLFKDCVRLDSAAGYTHLIATVQLED